MQRNYRLILDEACIFKDGEPFIEARKVLHYTTGVEDFPAKVQEAISNLLLEESKKHVKA